MYLLQQLVAINVAVTRFVDALERAPQVLELLCLFEFLLFLLAPLALLQHIKEAHNSN